MPNSKPRRTSGNWPRRRARRSTSSLPQPWPRKIRRCRPKTTWQSAQAEPVGPGSMRRCHGGQISIRRNMTSS